MFKYNTPETLELSKLGDTLPTISEPEKAHTTTTTTAVAEQSDQCRILLLPVELQIRIFIFSQNPVLPLVCKQFWDLGQSVTVRAQYLMQRYGPTAVLGKRSMKRKIVLLGVVEQLLKLKCCDPRADGDYWLFTQACELKQVELCRWIIESALLLEHLQEEKRKVLAHLLNIASMKGAIPIIDLLVDTFGVDIHQPNGDETALTLACRENRLETVKHLKLKYGCNVHSHTERHLRSACLHGYKELVNFFLSVGSDIHAYNDAALQNAAYKGFSSIVKVLLDAGANAETNQNACIQHAITNGNIDSVKYLISAGANPRCDHDWPLRHACRKGLDDILEYLMDVISKQVDNVTNIRDGMPLEECIMYGRLSTIQLLLHYGADPNSGGAIRGLRYAVNSKTKTKHKGTMIKLLIEAGLDLN